MTENSTADSSANDERSVPGSEPTSYADAISEVEEILASLEGSAIDVDHLAGQVERASFLLQICRERLAKVQGDVAELVVTIGSDSVVDGPEAGEAGPDA